MILIGRPFFFTEQPAPGADTFVCNGLEWAQVHEVRDILVFELSPRGIFVEAEGNIRSKNVQPSFGLSIRSPNTGALVIIEGII